MSEKLRVIFMGTAPLACASLQALLNHPEVSVVAVVTQPDRPKGRQLKLRPSEVKVLAQKNDLPVLQPEKARDPEFIEKLTQLSPSLIVVTAYGQILPKSILKIPRYGCLNIHTSILPKYRGAAPIQWAILDGEPETGVTLMKMDAGMDTGDIIAIKKTPIESTDDAESVHDRLAILGGELLTESLAPFVRGEIQPRPQPEAGASHARKISKQDGLIDWNRRAVEIWNQVRGLSPWPGAFTLVSLGGERMTLKIWSVEPLVERGEPGVVLKVGKDDIAVGCGEGSVSLKAVQLPGGRRVSAKEFLAGHKIQTRSRLG